MLRRSDEFLTIGMLAGAAGVGIETVRYYERRGLLPSPPRAANGYRLYSSETVRRLHFVRRAKQLGFTLNEIADLLRLQHAAAGRAEVKRLARHRLADLDARLRDLRRMRDTLATLEAQCSGQGPVRGCPVIETLSDEATD